MKIVLKKRQRILLHASVLVNKALKMFYFPPILDFFVYVYNDMINFSTKDVSNRQKSLDVFISQFVDRHGVKKFLLALKKSCQIEWMTSWNLQSCFNILLADIWHFGSSKTFMSPVFLVYLVVRFFLTKKAL